MIMDYCGRASLSKGWNPGFNDEKEASIWSIGRETVLCRRKLFKWKVSLTVMNSMCSRDRNESVHLSTVRMKMVTDEPHRGRQMPDHAVLRVLVRKWGYFRVAVGTDRSVLCRYVILLGLYSCLSAGIGSRTPWGYKNPSPLSKMAVSESWSVVSNSLWPHGLYSTGIFQVRILEWVTFPFPNPGIQSRYLALQSDSLPAEPKGTPNNTGEGSLSLLQGIFQTQESNQGLLHCRQILYQLELSGKPLK